MGEYIRKTEDEMDVSVLALVWLILLTQRFGPHSASQVIEVSLVSSMFQKFDHSSVPLGIQFDMDLDVNKWLKRVSIFDAHHIGGSEL